MTIALSCRRTGTAHRFAPFGANTNLRPPRLRIEIGTRTVTLRASWDWVDPLKDARAEIEQIDAGLKSRTQALAERGYDAEQVDAEMAADKAREGRLGLTFGKAAMMSVGDAGAEQQSVADQAALG